MVSQVDTACNQPGDALSKVAARLKSPIFLSQRSVRNEQAVIDAIEVPMLRFVMKKIKLELVMFFALYVGQCHAP